MPKDESGRSPSMPREFRYVVFTRGSPDSKDTRSAHCSSVKHPLDCSTTNVVLPSKLNIILNLRK